MTAKWTNLGTELPGITTWLGIDEASDQLVTLDQQSAAANRAILAENKEFRQVTSGKRRISRHANMRKLADIPLAMFMAWRREWERKFKGEYKLEEYIAAKLHDPQNAGLRCTDESQADGRALRAAFDIARHSEVA